MPDTDDNINVDSSTDDQNPRDLRAKLEAANARAAEYEKKVQEFEAATAKAAIDDTVKELGLDGFVFPEGLTLTPEGVKSFYEANKSFIAPAAAGAPAVPAPVGATTATPEYQAAVARTEAVATGATPPSDDKLQSAAAALIADRKTMSDPGVSVNELYKQLGINISS